MFSLAAGFSLVLYFHQLPRLKRSFGDALFIFILIFDILFDLTRIVVFLLLF